MILIGHGGRCSRGRAGGLARCSRFLPSAADRPVLGVVIGMLAVVRTDRGGIVRRRLFGRSVAGKRGETAEPRHARLDPDLADRREARDRKETRTESSHKTATRMQS